MRSRAAAGALLGLLCVLSGCSELISNSEVSNVALPSQEELAGLVRATSDVAVRIAPSLNNPAAGPRLRTALESLTAALNSADGPASAKALDETRAALDAYKLVAAPAEGPDLGAVEIAYTRINALLQRPCSRSNSRLPSYPQQSCIGT